MLPLESLRLDTMASGHLCLTLTSQISWDAFPAYADELVLLLDARVGRQVDGPAVRIWTVTIQGTALRLVVEEHPALVGLESDSEEGDALLRLLEDGLARLK